MGHLNWVSLLGLFVMILLAWLFSSHKTKVNWRLVIVGVLLQFGLAAVLFQSQHWTFNREFESFTSLEETVAANGFPVVSVDVYAADRGLGSFEQMVADLASGAKTTSSVNTALQNESGLIDIARYPNGILFSAVNTVFASINNYVKDGSSFVFRANVIPEGNPTDPMVLLGTFAFGVLPTVIFFASLMAILYYLGVMQVVIKGMAWVMRKTLGTSGPESMAAAANVLVGHTEAPLVIRPYVARMTRSELNALMVGGFSTISGSLMVIFIFYGIEAGHLLTASIISAPAALVIAKILQPETETADEIAARLTMPLDGNEAEDQGATNVIEAAAIGASEGVKLAINITAMLIAFLALLAMLNALLTGAGELTEYCINKVWADQPIDLRWSLDNLFAMVFYPLAWVMGIQPSECSIAGELLGKKVVVNEFIAYSEMGLILDGKVLDPDGNP
ncbi:MAG: nucleoside transporter C-terminal domain-containing protein, partial [Mariniblastus sp.]|nr:nucleoside transporter C-terminal domain-containing protein [Mariniblastus sp.]